MKNYLFVYVGCCLFLSIAACTADKNRTSGRSVKPSGIVIANNRDAIVLTESGKVGGYIDDSVYIFKGVPYAEAERFMPPTKPTPWEGVRSSRAYGPVSPQEFRTGWLTDEMAFLSNWDDGYPGEDCLRLNIWTPQVNDGKKRPVMVWLHGGGYSTGSGQEQPAYEGSNLARKGDMVVVTLNHRLNVLGFLDLSAYGEKYAYSGNVGLLDLVSALEWVKNNISGFGGDPGNVTIFGQSGIGGKVSTLLAMPAANGLFHKAIVQSGPILRVMESKYSRRIGVATLHELGLSASQIGELKTIPYEQLLEAGNKAMATEKESLRNGSDISLFNWGPTVDGDILPHQPFEGKAPSQSKNIPMLIGSMQHEFMDEAVNQAKLKQAQEGAPVYTYLFMWESPVLNYAFRSIHTMEIPFVFDNIYLSRTATGGGSEAYALAEKMSGAWISFAYTGNPNTADLPAWPPYTTDNGACMIFDNTCEVRYKE